MEMGRIEGNAPKSLKSTVTRRHTNMVADIKGTTSKVLGSVPEEARERLMQNDKTPFVATNKLKKL